MSLTKVGDYLYHKIKRDEHIFFIRHDIIGAVDVDNDDDEILFEFSDHVLSLIKDEWFLMKGKTIKKKEKKI